MTRPGNTKEGRPVLWFDPDYRGGGIGIPVKVLAHHRFAVFGYFAGNGKVGAAE